MSNLLTFFSCTCIQVFVLHNHTGDIRTMLYLAGQVRWLTIIHLFDDSMFKKGHAVHYTCICKSVIFLYTTYPHCLKFTKKICRLELILARKEWHFIIVFYIILIWSHTWFAHRKILKLFILLGSILKTICVVKLIYVPLTRI